MRLRALAITALVVLAVQTGQATASRPFSTGFDFPSFQTEREAASGIWLDRAVRARSSIVRVNVSWAAIAPSRPPAHPADPAWPGYRWTDLDAAVRDTAAHGLRVLFTVGWAPRWAEGPGRPRDIEPGAWKPRPGAYGAFAHALATRYSGTFPDPLRPGVSLPRVGLYEAWNEPNLDVYLAPQWVGKRLVGPTLYRPLLNQFYAGVKDVQPGATVLAGAQAPFGDLPGGERTPPVQFLRSLLCLQGAQLKPRPCSRPAHLDALSHHPIAVGAPLRSALSPLNATTPDLRRLERVLRKAERRGRVLPGGRRPLWVTEFWYDSRPPDPHGLPLATQARWYEQALYLFWRAGARAALTLQLADSPRGQGYAFTLQSGVFFRDGRPKPSYTAFRFPLVGERLRDGKVLVWGIAPARGRVHVQARRAGGWRTVAIRRARGRTRPFTARLRLRTPVALRALLAGDKSLVWKQR